MLPNKCLTLTAFIAQTLEEGNGSGGQVSLTQKGQEQLDALGREMRELYFLEESNFRMPAMATYDADQVRMESSDFDRTLASAMSLSRALWLESNENNSALVPVHSAPREDDIALRSHTNCPAFNAQLRGVYSSDLFTQKRYGFSSLSCSQLRSACPKPVLTPLCSYLVCSSCLLCPPSPERTVSRSYAHSRHFPRHWCLPAATMFL